VKSEHPDPSELSQQDFQDEFALQTLEDQDAHLKQLFACDLER
jgi:hypothetical protein